MDLKQKNNGERFSKLAEFLGLEHRLNNKLGKMAPIPHTHEVELESLFDFSDKRRTNNTK